MTDKSPLTPGRVVLVFLLILTSSPVLAQQPDIPVGEELDVDREFAALVERGRAWSRKGEYDTAIAKFTEAIRLNPDGASAYRELASIRASCPNLNYRDGRKAVELATRACELTGWKDAESLLILARAYAANDEFGKSLLYMGKAQKLVEDNAVKPKDHEPSKLSPNP